MKAISPTALLAATTEAGVVLHDVLGALSLAALLILGFFLRERQHRRTGPPASAADPAGMDRKFGQLQMWIVYWLVVAVTVGFFFVMPRATSQKAQMMPHESSRG